MDGNGRLLVLLIEVLVFFSRDPSLMAPEGPGPLLGGGGNIGEHRLTSG